MRFPTLLLKLLWIALPVKVEALQLPSTRPRVSRPLQSWGLIVNAPTTLQESSYRYRYATALAGSGSWSERDDEEARARNDARTDVRNFLTQRAIQSFLYLLEQCRDPHSGKWIEDFLGTQNLLEFHGTGAGYINRFGGTWEGPLVEMLDKPKDVVIVSAKRRGKGHGGWSKHNPYLEDRYVEFEIDIDPVSLTSRILSVREQLANEFLNDLQILDEANQQILTSYFSRVKEERGSNIDPDNVEDNSNRIAFDRVAVNILNNHTSFATVASSPFRRGSFDLLYNLCTQASVHRLLREFARAGSAKEVSFAWMRDFYISRVEDYFDGDQQYGRADQFMEELLLTNPSVIIDEHGKMGLADPLGLAEQIIETRSKVIAEWKDLMAQVPQDHAAMRQVLLVKQMESWSSAGTSTSSEEGFQ